MTHPIALRPPSQVMRLARLGSFHQCRLSFMRVLLRGMRREAWRFDRPLWEIDTKGVGRAVYRAIGPTHTYSLVAFAHDLPDDQRSDRVIAEAWDATFTLVDGTPTQADLDRLADNVPLQEAGRVSDNELVLSRANRSVRLWSHVIDALASGRQPDIALIDRVGYLMRTTAVYGSGKFGAADHGALGGRGLMDGPFRAEMLTVWLIRTFCLDLVEHLADQSAHAKGGTAISLDPAIKRRFGIGNSTGLGMAPFLVNHPALLHAWINAREVALARVRALHTASSAEIAMFREAVAKASAGANTGTSEHPYQIEKLTALRRDCAALVEHLDANPLTGIAPWDTLAQWAETTLSPEGQELLVSLMLEPYGALIDDLADQMGADEAALFAIDASWTAADLRKALTKHYTWLGTTNAEDKEQTARFWYVSEAKLEPRLGERYGDPGAELELPLDIAHQAAALGDTLLGYPDTTPAAQILADHPQHRRIVRRVQITANAPYAEIQDNLIAHDMLPIDMLRCKLSFFGATRFDPRSDRWVRITMFQNAPFPADLAAEPEDAWIYPAPDGDPAKAA